MAKSGNTRSGGTSRVRFIMLDAELADGDLTQIVHAIQNALRPNPALPPRVAAPPALSGGAEAPHIEHAQAVIDEQDISENAEKPVTKPARSERASRPRKVPSVEVIDVDLLSPPSFAEYIADKDIDSDVDRFLTVAAWFKECRQVSEITANHVYTCYRAANWPSKIEDFAQPLRNLKFRKFMTSPSRGLFSINHIGLAHVTGLSNG
jgi:hypothetical protein